MPGFFGRLKRALLSSVAAVPSPPPAAKADEKPVTEGLSGGGYLNGYTLVATPRVPRRDAEEVAPVAPVRPAPIPVRIATPQDEEGVLELCRLMHAETAFFALDENEAREAMRPSLRQEGGVVCVIGEPGKLEAIINLTFQSHWYSHEMFLADRMTFVHPDHRNGEHFTRLIQYAKTFADMCGCALMLGLTSATRTEAKVRLLRRELGEPVGALFFYDARPRADAAAPSAEAA